MLKARNVVLFGFIIALTHIAQLRWIDIDNQAFAQLFPGANYDGHILPPNFGRVILFAIAIPFSKQILQAIGLLPKALLVAAAVAVASILWSVDLVRSISVSTDLFLTLIFAVLATKYLGSRLTLRAIWWFGISVISVSVLFAALGDRHALMSGIHEGLWRGLFNHKNIFGAFVAAILCLTVVGRTWLGLTKFQILFALVLCVIASIEARSATSLVSVVFAISVALVNRVPLVTASNRFVFYVILAILFVAASFGAPAFFDAAASSLGRDVTLTGRTGLWVAALPFTTQSPFGWGNGTSGGLVVLEAMRQNSGWSTAGSVHSSYIQMALDIGWPTTIIYTIWLISNVVVLRARQRDQMSLLAALATLHFASGITEVGFGLDASISFIMLVVAVISFKSSRKLVNDSTVVGSARELPIISPSPR